MPTKKTPAKKKLITKKVAAPVRKHNLGAGDKSNDVIANNPVDGFSDVECHSVDGASAAENHTVI